MTQTRSTRLAQLAAGVVCLALVAVLAVLVHHQWSTLADVDRHLGGRPFRFTSDHAWARHLWVGVGHGFSTIPVVVVVAVVALALLWKGHRRAAAWTVGVVTAYLADWTTGSLAQVITFVLVVVFLQVKPQGLFTVRTRGLA